MTSMMDRALAMAASRLPAAAGGSIAYGRGVGSVTLSATFGQTEFTVEDGDGVRVEHSDRDFIVAAASLVLDSVAILPERGDRVAVLDDSGEIISTFEVLAPASAKPYRFCDPQGTLLRIHAKRLR